MIRVFKTDNLLTSQCTREPRHDSYAILEIRYHQPWRALVVNGDAIPISRKMVGAGTIVPVSARVGNTKGGIVPPWFNAADAALLASRMHPVNRCIVAVRLVPRKDTADTYDLVPSTHLGFTLLSTPLISVFLPSNVVDPIPEFTFRDETSASPSTTYAWRSGFIYPMMQYFTVMWLLLAVVAILAIALSRFARTSRVAVESASTLNSVVLSVSRTLRRVSVILGRKPQPRRGEPPIHSMELALLVQDNADFSQSVGPDLEKDVPIVGDEAVHA